MTPASVLLVTPRWTRDGGVATHVVSSAAALAGRDIEVHVLAARLELSERIPGVTLHHSPRLYDVNASPEVRIGDARSLSPSVVHTHQFEDPDLLSFMQIGSPIVISVHGYSACTSGVHYFGPGHECTRAHGPGCVPNLLLRGCAHGRNPVRLPAAYARVTRGLEALRRADMVVSYSSTIDRHLSANGLTRRAMVPLFATIPARSAGGHAQRRRVVFAGRVVRTKGVDVLIRAARNVDADFVICGDGGRLEAMRELAGRLGVQERVRFAGWLGADDLALELAEASVVVMPSLWPEPAGLVGLEAQAAGRPVIASATGGVEDWLEDGVNGMCVRPGDARDLARALDELLADPDRQAAMGAAGRQMVSERFTPERHVAALMQVYETARASWAQAPRTGQPAEAQRRPPASIARS